MNDNDRKDKQTGYMFLLIFVFLAAGILTSGYFAYRNYEKSYRTEIEQQLSAIAESKVDQLVQWRKERIGDGQVFYKNNEFSVVVKRYLRKPNDQEAKTKILAWVGQVQRAYSYDLMMLLDAQFNTRLVFPENREQARLVIDQRNTEILLSGNIAFQDFYRNEQDQHIYLKILVPILDDHSPRRMIACLALRIDPTQYLYPMIEKWPTLSKTSETLIVRRDGNDALFLNKLKYLKDAALKLRIPLERKEVLAVKAVLGIEGVVEGLDYRGELVIGDVRAIPDSPWFLVARMDTSEVYAPLRERLWLMIILVGALLTGAGASVGLIWRHQSNRFYREQYHSAEALRDSESRYRTLIEQASDGIFLSDSEGRYIEVNSAGCQLLGYTREEILKKTIRDLTSVTTEQPLRLDELRAGKSFLSKREMIRKDGSLVPVEISAKQLSDGNFQGIVRDITERRRAEEALKESEKKFRRLLESTPLPLCYVNKDGVITFRNERFVKVFGYAKDEVPTLTEWWLNAYPEAQYRQWVIQNWDSAVRHAAETGTDIESEEYHVTCKDGTLREIIISGITINNDFLATFIDITERKRTEVEARNLLEMSERSRSDLLSILEDQKRAEEEVQKLNAELENRVVERTAQLETANKELEAFSYSVSHDLRAPLRAIDGFSRIIVEEYAKKLDAEGKRLLSIIRTSTKKMDELITDLLSLSRFTRSEMQLSRVNMSSLANSIYHEIASPEIRKNFSFSVAAIPDAFCDHSLIRQVWVNLISNAIKFTTPKDVRTIEIGSRLEDGMNIYSIRDSGVGFNPEYAHKLFGVFQRLHKAEEFEGTGVGLAIVQRIIHRHGGRVWAEGKVGEGATFYFSIPDRQ